MRIQQYDRASLPERDIRSRQCECSALYYFIDITDIECTRFQRGKLACIEFTGNIAGYASSVVSARLLQGEANVTCSTNPTSAV